VQVRTQTSHETMVVGNWIVELICCVFFPVPPVLLHGVTSLLCP